MNIDHIALAGSMTMSPIEITGIIASHYSRNRYLKSSFMFTAFLKL